MKIGDLVEHYTEPHNWGIILAKCMHQYEIYWMDGERTWISKRSMVAKKSRTKNVLDKKQSTYYIINITTKHWR